MPQRSSPTLNPGVFELVAPYPPAGDQPAAINALVQGIGEGTTSQVLMGVTGSGKTECFMLPILDRLAEVPRPPARVRIEVDPLRV